MRVREKLQVQEQSSSSPEEGMWQGASVCVRSLSLQGKAEVQLEVTFCQQALRPTFPFLGRKTSS